MVDQLVLLRQEFQFFCILLSPLLSLTFNCLCISNMKQWYYECYYSMPGKFLWNFFFFSFFVVSFFCLSISKDLVVDDSVQSRSLSTRHAFASNSVIKRSLRFFSLKLFCTFLLGQILYSQVIRGSIKVICHQTQTQSHCLLYISSYQVPSPVFLS